MCRNLVVYTPGWCGYCQLPSVMREYYLQCYNPNGAPMFYLKGPLNDPSTSDCEHPTGARWSEACHYHTQIQPCLPSACIRCFNVTEWVQWLSSFLFTAVNTDLLVEFVDYVKSHAAPALGINQDPKIWQNQPYLLGAEGLYGRRPAEIDADGSHHYYQGPLTQQLNQEVMVEQEVERQFRTPWSGQVFDLLHDERYDAMMREWNPQIEPGEGNGWYGRPHRT